MGKGQRTRAGRADKQRPRQRKNNDTAQARPLPGGWHAMDDDLDNLPDSAFEPPDEKLLDTSRCPVADQCASCGATTGLEAVTSAMAAPSGYEVACATLCRDCEGGSFLHLLTHEQYEHALASHADHAS